MVTDINELMSRKEELCPELTACLVEGCVTGIALAHPLVQEVFYTPDLNAWYNARYHAKREAAEKATEAKDWSKVLVLHERPWRWEALANLSLYMDDETLAKEFAWVWSDSENIWQNETIIQELMERLGDPKLKPFLMEESDLAHFNSLPDQIKVYRGCKEHNRRGMSWTQSLERARWFAERLRRPADRGMVLKGEVAKEDVLFYTNGRGEQEIVIMNELVQHPRIMS